MYGLHLRFALELKDGIQNGAKFGAGGEFPDIQSDTEPECSQTRHESLYQCLQNIIYVTQTTTHEISGLSCDGIVPKLFGNKTKVLSA